jgi:Na+-driven multidrug efflux pump
MRRLALHYLTIRSLGSPAVLLSLAMIGVFRGFKDTKTPLYATGKVTIIV